MDNINIYRIKFIVTIFLIIGISLIGSASYAKKISGYEDLIAIYAADLSDDEQSDFILKFQEVDRKALDQILKKELSASLVERNHIYRQSQSTPTKIFQIDQQYAAIGFEKLLNYRGQWEKSAYVLLLEIQSPQNISYTGSYLFWRGMQSIGKYESITTANLCKELSGLARVDGCKESGSRQMAAAAPPKPKTETAPPPPESAAKIVKEPDLTEKMAEMAQQMEEIHTLLQTKARQDHTHDGRDITSGIVKESYIDAALARDKEFQTTMEGTVFSGKDDAYITGLENRIMELETTVQKLTAMLAGVSREEDTILISGVNVQVVNGTGSTNGKVNGKGNLIVGYNQISKEKNLVQRNGSHNFILGDGHEYTSYGGLVAGLSNEISGAYSSVIGGLRNEASGDYSTVNGGHFQTAVGVCSVSLTDSVKTEDEEKKQDGCFINALRWP